MDPKIMLPPWASSSFVFYSLLSTLYVFIAASPALADMQFTTRPNASVTYLIQVQIGAGNDAKRYPGRLTYVVKSAAPDLIQLNAFGSIEGVYRSFSPFDRNTSMLPPLGRVSISSTVIGIDPLGKLKVSQRDESLEMLLATLGPKGSDVQATEALVQLAQRKPRLEPGLASALLERADRKGDRGATLFYQQAAQYDPSLKNVAEDRADYARGDFPVKRTGGPIIVPSRLQPGQLIAVSREPFSGFEAAEFVSVDSGGMVSYQSKFHWRHCLPKTRSLRLNCPNKMPTRFK